MIRLPKHATENTKLNSPMIQVYYVLNTWNKPKLSNKRSYHDL